jgi:tetratricopeptide (TPR) repeat protein
LTKAARPSKNSWMLGLCVAVCFCIWTGCGGSRQVKSNIPGSDREFDRNSRMARTAFENGQISQAIEGYKRALARAYITDDISAIVDMRYNLAVCNLRQGNYPDALENVEKAQQELLSAGRPVSADLLLVQAVAFYHDGTSGRAWQISEEILSVKPAPSPEVVSKTHFLRGMIAADRGDMEQLRLEITALGEPSVPGLRADRFELIGHLAMLDGRWDDAVTALDQAASMRAVNRNYRSMATVLATAAQACERAQRSEDAAYRYLRAARSAALSGDAERATVWLQESVRLADLAGAEAILDEARRFQALLPRESLPRPFDQEITR